jgi:hypothetical protein
MSVEISEGYTEFLRGLIGKKVKVKQRGTIEYSGILSKVTGRTMFTISAQDDFPITRIASWERKPEVTLSGSVIFDITDYIYLSVEEIE